MPIEGAGGSDAQPPRASKARQEAAEGDKEGIVKV
jgi:hypothetical protein